MKRHLSKILVLWSAFLKFVNSPRKLSPGSGGRVGGGGGEEYERNEGSFPAWSEFLVIRLESARRWASCPPEFAQESA